MAMVFPRARVLPATIVAMGLLLATKSVGMLQDAMGASAVKGAGATGVAAVASSPGGSSSGSPSVSPSGSPSVSSSGSSGGAVAGDGTAQASGASSPPMSAAAPAVVSNAAPSASTAPLAVAPVPPVSDAERNLLLDLRHRRDTLDARDKSQQQRDAVMAAAEKKLAARVTELNALQSKLETLEAARQSHDTANWASLVHIYETMKPRDAATIFDALDMQVLLGVLDRMAERKAAPILAAMQPERARLATQLLAELRTRSVTPAAAADPAVITPAGLTSAHAPDPKG